MASAARTVRSAPVSIWNVAGTQSPAAVRRLTRTTGRVSPSSPSTHSPSIRINLGPPVRGDEFGEEGPGLIRVRIPSPGVDLNRVVTDEQLAAGDADELADVLLPDLAGEFLVAPGVRPVPFGLELGPVPLLGSGFQLHEYEGCRSECS